MRLRLVSVFVLAACATGCASAPDRMDEKWDTEPSAEIEPVVDRATWMETLHETLRSDLCAEDEIYRSCFYLSESDCHARVSQVAESCASEYRNAMPEAFNDSQGQQWAGRIGKCVGDGLYEVMSSSYAFHQTEKCSKILSEL